MERRKKSAMTREERLERRKVWNRTYKEKHPEKCKAVSRADNLKRKDAMRKWRDENRDQYNKKKLDWYYRNKETVNEKAKAYWKSRPGEKAAHCAKRRAQKRRSTPVWADEEKMKQVYVKAQEYGLTVDHIVPLKSGVVSGLHCWWNLQLLAPELNYSKGNRFWPDM